MVREECGYGLEYIKLNQGEAGGLIIREEILHSLNQFAGPGSGKRLVPDGAESHSGKIAGIQFSLECICINPFCSKDLERKSVTHSYLQKS